MFWMQVPRLAIFAALALLSFARPADATALSATVTAVGPTSSTDCPTRVIFNGVIDGPASSSVMYHFVYLDPQTKSAVIVPGKLVTIPPSETMTVMGAISVSAAQAGSSWVRLVLKSGANVVASKSAAFSVTCNPPGAPSPPVPAPATQAPIVSRSTGLASRVVMQPKVMNVLVPSPTGLNSTTDQAQCNQHGGFAGGLACKAGLPNGMVALIWNYCAGCNADGFHLYRVDEGRHDAVSIPANGTSVTIALLDVPAGGFNGKCYSVTAYRGSAESNPSPPYCVGSGAVSTVALKPDHVRSSVENASWGGIAFTSAEKIGSSQTYPQVGYTHQVESQTYTNPTWSNTLARAGLYFDVAQIMHKNIFSATLHLRVSTSMVYNYPGKAQSFDDKNYITDHVTSCTGNIGTGSDYWWTYPGMITQTSALSPGIHSGPDVGYDVTDIVKQWAHGSPNFGFVLSGESEPIDTWLGRDSRAAGFLAHMCMTQYTNDVWLEVKFTG